jgi:transcriptional regulator with XRE-family HTH domain
MNGPTVDQLIGELTRVRLLLGLSNVRLAEILDAPKSSLSEWQAGRHRPSAAMQERIREWLASPNTHTRLTEATRMQPRRDETAEAEGLCIDIAGHLNVLVEHLLPFFVDGSRSRREVYQAMLVNPDMGYVITALEALGKDEPAFQRWRMFTTHEFGRFGLRRSGRGKTRNRTQQGERPRVPRSAVPQPA